MVIHYQDTKASVAIHHGWSFKREEAGARLDHDQALRDLSAKSYELSSRQGPVSMPKRVKWSDQVIIGRRSRRLGCMSSVTQVAPLMRQPAW